MKIRACSVCCGAFLLVSAAFLFPATAAAADEVDQEFTFASGLIDLGFSDLAKRVVDEVLRLHPEEQDRATRIQGEILIAQRKFPEAEALLQQMPADNPQRHALQLRIANGYFRIGETEQAQRLYDAFFGLYRDRIPTDPDLLRFYQDAAYQYGQMQERLGNRRAAAEAYERLIKAGMDDDGAKRRLQMDLARLFLQLGRESSGSEQSDFLNRAYSLCEDVQWGGYDLWFGQSIGLMANIELARGNPEAARSLLQGYMEDLTAIDQLLREQNVPAALSPVASARFLLGELYERQVNELRSQNAPERDILQAIQKALTEFYNVFGKYGTSEWGAEAGSRGRALVAMLDKDYGRKVNIDFGEHAAEAAAAQYAAADDLYRQRKYDEAVEAYLLILNAFPEDEPSKRALANLLMCYAQMDDAVYARMMSAYLAERFAGETMAANALLLASRVFMERQNTEMTEQLFADFLRGFPQHERAPMLLFDMARRADQQGDTAAAAGSYEQLLSQYPEDRFALLAMLELGKKAYDRGEFAAAAEQYGAYVGASRPGHDRVRGQFLLAESLQKDGQFLQAVQAYGQLLNWTGDEDGPDNARAEDREKNAAMAERALFFVGYCFGRISQPADRLDAFRQRAVKAYDQFLQQYADSDLAPAAMRDKGAMQLALGDNQVAAQTFELLAERYPDSEEGRSALFALVNSALEVGKVEIAQGAFRRMMASPETFSAEEFTRVGQLMLDAGLYDDVIPAYEQVVATTDQRQMLELALFGLGTAYQQQGRHAEAVQQLSDLLERFPNSAYYFRARFLLAQSATAMEAYDQAQTALADILRLSDDNVLNQRAQFQLGLLQRQRGEPQQALATFQRITLLQDPGVEALRPIIEDSYVASVELMQELELFADVQDLVDQFETDFGSSPELGRMRQARTEALRRVNQ
jgi:TolA-binding protein